MGFVTPQPTAPSGLSALLSVVNHFWYTRSMTSHPPILAVKFFRTDAGNEPVRDWLVELPKAHRRLVGEDIKTVQFGWPIGMPVVRKLEDGLWEVRTTLDDTIARVIFTVVSGQMVLLHAFIKKSQKTPTVDLNTAKQRKAKIQR